VRRAEEAADAAAAELADWAGGRRCIRLETEEQVILSVDAPAWAAPLDPQRWVGHEMGDLFDLIGAVLGPVERLAPVDPSDEEGLVVHTRNVATTPDGPILIRSSYVPRLGRLLLVTEADLAG
jgi:hypothetical protein